MKKRVVIALGGNALGNTLPEQMIAVKETSKAIVDLIEADCDVIVTHGNGPQIGMINNAMAALTREVEGQPNTPLSVCVAMSQAYIGYDLQNALREELLNRGITDLPVTTMVTQVRVDADDPAFLDPTKPIGHFMTKEEAVKTAESVAEFIRTESGELSPVDWYVKALAREIAGIVSPYYTDDINEPMVVRLPDFKTNEHADLLGGRAYEPVEENPMLGDRGAGKYLGAYQKAFLAIDLKALAYVINDMGYTNIHIEVPFVRTPNEMKEIARLVKESGINIPLQMMFELPVNISRATEFFKVSDGGQIGSNDLLQLEFGLDRSGGDILPWHIQHLQSRIENLIQERNTTKPEFHLGLCGNLPSTNPEFAKWLVDAGIDEFSVTPDALIPALLGVTGETPDGKQNITVYTAEGEVFINGQKA